jgi:mono/diheme cytochrome c family protein
MRIVTIFSLLTLLAACDTARQETTVPGRWYTAEQVTAGKDLYMANCAICHAEDGSATVEWRTPGADGHYPPPPLNGSAHTWHHPLEVLESTIANGGVAFGGVMPGFAATLGEDERLAVIAWIQDLWSDDIYSRWKAIDERTQ